MTVLVFSDPRSLPQSLKTMLVTSSYNGLISCYRGIPGSLIIVSMTDAGFGDSLWWEMQGLVQKPTYFDLEVVSSFNSLDEVGLHDMLEPPIIPVPKGWQKIINPRKGEEPSKGLIDLRINEKDPDKNKLKYSDGLG